MSKNQPISTTQQQNIYQNKIILNQNKKTDDYNKNKQQNITDHHQNITDHQNQNKYKAITQPQYEYLPTNQQNQHTPRISNEQKEQDRKDNININENISKKNQSSSHDITFSSIDVINPLQHKHKSLGMKNAFKTVQMEQFQKQNQHQDNYYMNNNNVNNSQRNQNQSIHTHSSTQNNNNINVKRENQQLKTKNQLLKRQLELFSQKLDQQISKRVSKEKERRNNKLHRPTDPELVESMELQNAYKKIQIYKREVNILKSKRTDFDDQKQNQYENKIKSLLQEITSLKQEIKTTKKIVKTQEKGLVQVGASGFFKVSQENQKHKEEIRRLKSQIDQLQRKYRMNDNNSYIKNKQTNSENRSAKQSQSKNHYFDKRSQTTQKLSQNRPFRKLNTKKGLRIKTQSNISATQQNQNNNSQQQIRLLKYEQKIRILTAQKSKQRQIIENLKLQVLEKDKEIISQRQKIQTLRKLVKQKQKIEKAILNHPKHEQQETQKDVNSKDYVKQEISMQNSHLKEQIPKGLQKKSGRQKESQDRQQSSVKQVNSKKYPRLDEKGLKYQTTFKWNHYQFSSKIKQIQILPNKQGFIKDIHVRYQKGQSKNQSTSTFSTQQKYSSFVCQQGQQFIKQIKGGFKNGYLQYLTIRTNFNRKAKFCKYDIQQQCQNFDFNILEQEYPCALYGESDNQGVKRLGCFIDIIKKQHFISQN